MVSGILCNKVTQITRLSDCLISIKITLEGVIAHVISCYAPQTRCPDEEKDDFWESVDAHLRSVPSDKHILIGGDLNGHIGQERDSYMQCHRGHGLGVHNADEN